jgi:hypothetical protein
VALGLPAWGAAPTRGLGPAQADAPVAVQPVYGRQVAVLVGIDRYADADVPSLSYAVRDVDALAALLRQRFGYDELIVLRNEAATREGVLAALSGLSSLRPDDAVLVFWAGHGATAVGAGGESVGYLVPHEGSLRPDRLPVEDISMEELRALLLRLIPARHRLLVVDACYGGLLTVRGRETLPPHELAYLDRARRLPAVQVLTAGGVDQQVLDTGPGGHSVFTGALLDALSAPFDYRTASELSFEVQDHVQRASFARGGHLQTPEFARLEGGGDFLFVPLGSPAARSPADLRAAALARQGRVVQASGWSLIALGAAGLVTGAVTHARYTRAPLEDGPMPGLYQMNRTAVTTGWVAGGLGAAALTLGYTVEARGTREER